MGRGLHSRWACESPEGVMEGNGVEGGSEASLYSLFLSLHHPEVTPSAEETGQVG